MRSLLAGGVPLASSLVIASVWSPICWSVAVLSAARVVAGAVVARLVADRREVERQPAALGEAVDVGVVGHQPVDVGRQRVGDGPVDRVRESGDCGAVRLAGLEHVDRPLDPARLEVDQAVDVAAERIGEKGASADQAELFALVEQEDDRTLERRWSFRIDATSSRVATPIPASPAPGPTGVLS